MMAGITVSLACTVQGLQQLGPVLFDRNVHRSRGAAQHQICRVDVVKHCGQCSRVAV